MTRSLLGLLLLAACGCGASDGGPSDAATSTDSRAGADAASPADAGPVTITGTAVTTHVFDDGQLDVAQDLSSREVEASVVSGTGYITVTGSGTAAGTFSIASVPPGERLVRVGNTYLAGHATTLDLGRSLLGRPDAVAAPDGSDFSVNIDGLDAPKPTDLVEAYSSNVPFFWANVLGDMTKLARQIHPERLVEGNKNDRVVVTQLAARTSSKGAPYLGLARAVTLASFSMKSGQVVSTPAATMATPPTTTLTLDWRRGVFRALRPSVNPQAKVTLSYLYVYALPGQPEVTDADSPDLFRTVGDGADDLDLGTVMFGNPFPAAWAVVAVARTGFAVSYTAPGATQPLDLTVSAVTIGPAATVTAGPIMPRVSPPRAPVIAGKSAFAAQAGVGLMPQLVWTSPSSGEPTYYHVEIFELGASAGATTATSVARIYTTDTQVRLPPQRLLAGRTYVAQIQAVLSPGADPTRAPFRDGLSLSLASVLTATFSP